VGTHWIFDLDGTLADGLSARFLRPGAVDLLSLLVDRRTRVSMWSAGGTAYVEDVTARLGIAGWFSSVGDKTVGHLGRWQLPAGWAETGVAVVCVDDEPGRLPDGVLGVAVRPWLGSAHDDGLVRLVVDLS
jgi:hypothetical protein